MNIESVSVDYPELENLAREADDLSDTMRTSWQRDWFSDENWPETDPLRDAVIAYRRSLRAAMERLAAGTDGLASHLRATASSYDRQALLAAQAFAHITHAD
jgi:hypothetical protein